MKKGLIALAVVLVAALVAIGVLISRNKNLDSELTSARENLSKTETQLADTRSAAEAAASEAAATISGLETELSDTKTAAETAASEAAARRLQAQAASTTKSPACQSAYRTRGWGGAWGGEPEVAPLPNASDRRPQLNLQRQNVHRASVRDSPARIGLPPKHRCALRSLYILPPRWG